MQRDYDTGESSGITFFVGTEVEHTPAFGKVTLFITGVQPVEDIIDCLTNNPFGIEHLYFGANQSFQINKSEDWLQWEAMIIPLLKAGWLCTLDLDVKYVGEMHDSGFCEYNNFIPQISVKIPYISLLNYNACVKIDDTDFKKSNPGIWVHQVHDLMSRDKFNDWSVYSKDKIIK
jgi:hypothetical protein